MSLDTHELAAAQRSQRNGAASMDADSVIRLRRVVLGLARRLNAASVGEGLTPAQASLLAIVVTKGPLGLAELSEIEGLNPTMLSRVVGKLDASGLVRRRRDPGDYRAALVEVTKAGEETWQRLSAERAKVISECVAKMPADQEAALVAALPALESLSEGLRANTIRSARPAPGEQGGT
jgi:DNA-binding MarR family transcriptional regulator